MPLRSLDIETETWQSFARAVRSRIEQDLERERATADALRARVVPAVQLAVDRARSSELCCRAWLYGSYARGRPTGRSDVDLLVEGCPDPMRVATMITDGCGLQAHVVTMEQAPETLRRAAMEQGVEL